MSEEKEKAILNVVKAALGEDVKHFNITKGEILDEEENYLSMSVCVQPNSESFSIYNLKSKEEKHYLQIDHFDDEFNLMVGEDGDHELNITYGNIYAQLYWDVILEEV